MVAGWPPLGKRLIQALPSQQLQAGQAAGLRRWVITSLLASIRSDFVMEPAGDDHVLVLNR